MAIANFFSWLARRSPPSLHSAAEYFLAPERLQTALHRERLRSDRNGQPFTLLTISGEEPGWNEAQLLGLADLLRRRLRLTDEAGLLESHRLGIILPETSADGAWKVAGDLATLCGDQFGPLRFDVYAYPRADSSDDDGSVGDPVRPVRPLEPFFVQPLPTWKRALDIVGALGLLGVFWPFMLLSAIAIKASSPGPVLFMQRRSGLAGRPFTIFKFRTMREGADGEKALLRSQSEQDGPAFKMSNDPRVTWIGALLRKTSIDELPQLFNVLRGEMSLVGPRPLPVEESRNCSPWQKRRLDVTPGITCVWQVVGRSRVSFVEWIRMDLDYAAQRTFFRDLKLLLATLPAVVLLRGAK